MSQRPTAPPDLVGGLPRPKQVDAANSQCACVCSYCVCFCKKSVTLDKLIHLVELLPHSTAQHSAAARQHC